jgi:hypothetical protein
VGGKCVYIREQKIDGVMMRKIVLYFFSLPTFLGLRLLVEGKSSCEWSESAGKSTRKFRGEEIHLQIERYLFGDKDDEPMELPTGIHSYKFR